MSFKITISENGKYIIGKVEGRLNREIAQQLAKEYVKLITSTGIKRILNDVRGVPDVMGIMDGYEYAYKDVENIGFPRDISAAIVADEGDTSHGFQETVANNAGFNLKVFHSFDQAVNWLLTDNS